MVPPTLFEIRELVFETVFGEFERYAEDLGDVGQNWGSVWRSCLEPAHPTEPIITQDQCLAKPPQRMRQTEDVHRVLHTQSIHRESAPGSGTRQRGAHPDVARRELAVLRVALLRERPADVRVEVRHHRARGAEVLEEQEHERELVQEVDA